jgi:hypothetical protein
MSWQPGASLLLFLGICVSTLRKTGGVAQPCGVARLSSIGMRRKGSGESETGEDSQRARPHFPRQFPDSP